MFPNVGKVLKTLYTNPLCFSIFGLLYVIYQEAVQKAFIDNIVKTGD